MEAISDQPMLSDIDAVYLPSPRRVSKAVPCPEKGNRRP
jgi:hypothetical protein